MLEIFRISHEPIIKKLKLLQAEVTENTSNIPLNYIMDT